MKSFIEIDNTFLIGYGFDDSIQAYTVTLDLMDNTIDNVEKWSKIFDGISDGRRLTLELHWGDDED